MTKAEIFKEAHRRTKANPYTTVSYNSLFSSYLREVYSENKKVNAKGILEQAIKLSTYGSLRTIKAAKNICARKCDKNWDAFISLVEEKMSWSKDDIVTKVKEYLTFNIEKGVA